MIEKQSNIWGNDLVRYDCGEGGLNLCFHVFFAGKMAKGTVNIPQSILNEAKKNEEQTRNAVSRVRIVYNDGTPYTYGSQEMRRIIIQNESLLLLVLLTILKMDGDLYCGNWFTTAFYELLGIRGLPTDIEIGEIEGHGQGSRELEYQLKQL